MSAVTEYLRKPKAAVVRALARAQSEASNHGVQVEHIKAAADRLLGASVTGPLSAAAVGYVETRFPARDGSRASVGPIPLPAFLGTLALVGSVVSPVGKNQLAHVASANYGLAAGTYGRAAGAASLAKKTARTTAKLPGAGPAPVMPPAIGYADEDDWTPAERELLGT